LNYHFVKSVSNPEITKNPFSILWNWIRTEFSKHIDFRFLSVTEVFTCLTQIYALGEHPVDELEMRAVICCEKDSTTFCNIKCIDWICVMFAFISL